MDKKLKQNFLLVAFGVCLFAALFQFSSVLGFLGTIFQLILPIITGCILAIFLYVPVNGIKKRIDCHIQKFKKKQSDKMVQIISFVIVMICIILALSLVLVLLIPELIRSFQSIYEQIKVHIPDWFSFLDSHNINAAWLEELLATVNLDEVVQGISDSVDVILENVADTLSSTVNIVIAFGFGIIIAIYIILDKEKLCRNTRKLVYAYLKTGWAEKILRFCRLFSQSFTNFLTGQCVEAVILGILMFLAFTIFKLPYASLIGVLTAVCAIIPYVGAFISCTISVLLILLVDPTLVLRCIVVYLVLQFIENQFIYPRIVGGSVGLSPLYTLIAAMLGGKLFGILGIIFFIPLTAVLIDFIKEDVSYRLNKR